MTKEAQKPETVTIIEAAEMLGVSVATLRRRVGDGVIKPLPTSPLLKQARRLEFLRSEIEKLLF